MNMNDTPALAADPGLTIAGKTYASRLLVGSGKYKDLEQTRAATEASGADIITVAIRRVNIGQDPNAPSLLDVVPPSRYTILPNTAGCYNAADAIYTLQLARELLGGHKLVKLEVLGDEKTLFPNMPETLKAAETLVKDGFDVMVYGGVGTASDAAIAMELGCDGVLMNTAIAGARDPIRMARAMKLAVEAGREAFLAGRIPKRFAASPSSPMAGRVV